VIDYDALVAASRAPLLVAVRRQGRPRGTQDLIIATTASATSEKLYPPTLRLTRTFPA
jgi:predicted nucleic acid-binding protein